MISHMRTLIRISALGGAVMLAACQELTVPNNNLPDRERATQEPVSTESFVSSSFRTFWPVAGHDDYPSWAFSTMAREITSGFADFGQLEVSTEPRTSWNNSPVNARRFVAETPWYGLYRTISAVNDAIIAIDDGLVIGDANRTARTKAVGKFIQGISLGYIGLYFDKGIVVDETTDLEAISTSPTFTPYAGMIDTAIAHIDAAIAVAQGTPFTLPADGWLFSAMTSDQFVRLANTYVARLMAYGPRTRAERDAVDWNAVIARIDAGIQTDFAPSAQPDILWDDWKRLVARVRQVDRPSDFGRPSYWVLGPADSSDGWVNWVATPVNERVGFQIVTQDRRIQGAEGPDSAGIYFGFNQNDIFAIARGSYRFSWYYYHRNGAGLSYETGPQIAIPVAEMDLLKAEALIRLNRADEAVPLINNSRVANGQLPPVTVDGPPDAAGCVPRKQNGDCGSLWDALRYEKGVEMVGVNGVTAFFDARGWQTLPQFTFIHLPVPGRELGTLQLENYTFGGPGGEASSPAPDPERCPVVLARCS